MTHLHELTLATQTCGLLNGSWAGCPISCRKCYRQQQIGEKLLFYSLPVKQ